VFQNGGKSRIECCNTLSLQGKISLPKKKPFEWKIKGAPAEEAKIKDGKYEVLEP